MSQLSFEGFSDVHEDLDNSSASLPRSTWYKGRILSHSSISLYQTCPQKWKFRYVDKVPEKPRSFFSFGKSVHNALEFLFTKPMDKPTLETLLAYYKEKWLSEGYESAAQEKWFYQEGDRILRGFYSKHHSDSEKILKVEFKFAIDVQGVPVTGFIDRIDNTPNGGIAIVDYKTGKAFDKSRVRRDSQLTLYQRAARELLGKPVESVTLYHLNSLTPLTVPAHSENQENELTQTILETGKGITEEKFEPRVDERGHCQWCDYQQICPAFSKKKANFQPTMAEKESLGNLADRYGKMQAKLDDFIREKEALRQNLLQSMLQMKIDELEGKFFSVKVTGLPESSEKTIEVQPLQNSKFEV